MHDVFKDKYCTDCKANLSNTLSANKLNLLVDLVCRPHHTETSRLLLQVHDAVLTTPGLLARVLNHLGCIKAIARCSTVNKCWQAASQQVQLRSIVLAPANGLTLAEAECFLEVYKKRKAQAQGTFSQLRHIDICITKIPAEDVQTDMVRGDSLIQSLLTILTIPVHKDINTSMLTSCQLSGNFQLKSMAQSLPVSLQHLVLEPDHRNCKQRAFNLSMFGKFVHLQTLHIDIWYHLLGVDGDPRRYILDVALPSLETLYLLHDGHFLQSPDFTLAACLPSLRHVGANVDVDCAQALLNLPKLEFAALRLTKNPNGNVAHLTVNKRSNLNWLVLDKSNLAQTTVMLDKAGVIIEFMNLEVDFAKSLFPFNFDPVI